MPRKMKPYSLPTIDAADDDEPGLFVLPTIEGEAPIVRAPRTPPAAPVVTDPVEDAKVAVALYETAFQARARTEQSRLTLATDSEYWLCLCFETRQQKEAFLERMKLSDLGDKHIDGLEVAARLGVPFSEEERVKWPKRRGHKKLSTLAGE